MFKIRHSSDVIARENFADLCNARGLIEAAEIGVHQGEFACAFLDRWKSPGKLLLIDPYDTYEGMWWRGRDADYDICVQEIVRRGHGWRVIFIKHPSPEAVTIVPTDWRLQFIYIDGSHTKEAVRQDLEAWWPRLAPGGVLAGHDYADNSGNAIELMDIQEGNGVVQALSEFTDRYRLPVQVTNEPHAPQSWYIEK